MTLDAAGALPSLTATVRAKGLDAPVVVHRDRWGIPHLQARTVDGLFFAQGFVMAQDRLFQMEHDRLRAYGRLASVVGDRAVAWDVFARRARLAAAAMAGYEAFDPETRRVLEVHAAGINAFLASTSARPVELQALGHEPEKWAPCDAVAVFLTRHVLFATLAVKLFRARVIAALGAEAISWFRQEGAAGTPIPLIVPPGAQEMLRELPVDEWSNEVAAVAGLPELGVLAGSNAWALAGERTANGQPILAGDPHRLLEVPNVYVQVHLAAPDIDALGLAFPGVPALPHFGQTPHVAWCVTNAMADYQDLFIERFRRQGDLLLVETPQGWEPAEVLRETIAVRDGSAHNVESVVTPHGPVVIGDPAQGTALALRSSGLLEPGGSLRTVLPLLRAKTIDDADTALAAWVEPANNYLLADRAGHIGYRTAGRIPRRAEVNAWIPVPGWDGRHEWEGWIEDAELPRSRDPEGGVLITANQRIVDASYPHVLGVDYVNGNRARRIAARLDGLVAATREDLAAVHRDVVSLGAVNLRNRITALDVAGLSDAARKLRERLVAWDGTMAREAVEPALFAEIRTELVRLIAQQERLAALGMAPFPDEPQPVWPLQLRLAFAIDTLLAQDPETVLGRGCLWSDLLREAVEVAATAAGNTLPHWGSRHRALPLHPLQGWSSELDAIIPVPAPELAGDLDCVFSTAGATGIFDDVIAGSTARYVLDLGNREAGGWIVPLGASGHPASPHYTDQQNAWACGELLPIVADWQRLASEAETTQRLEP